MQLTNNEVLGVLNALNTLATKKLPVKLSWKIATAHRELETFAKAVDGPIQELRSKHAVKDADGNLLEAFDENGVRVPNTIQIPNDKIALLNAEIGELLSAKVEVHNVTLALADFPDSLELEPSVLNALMPIIVNE